jgi:hypothetical protein
MPPNPPPSPTCPHPPHLELPLDAPPCLVRRRRARGQLLAARLLAPQLREQRLGLRRELRRRGAGGVQAGAGLEARLVGVLWWGGSGERKIRSVADRCVKLA